MPRLALLTGLAGLLIAVPATLANHLPGHSCSGCASHEEWPTVNGKFQKANGSRDARYVGTRRNDELLGHHGSDVLSGRGGSDILWGDHDPAGQPASQNDLILGGAGNDAISVHYGRGEVDCGPGRDIYHVARTRKKGYRFTNCEKVDYRSERQRGGGLRPLP